MSGCWLCYRDYESEDTLVNVLLLVVLQRLRVRGHSCEFRIIGCVSGTLSPNVGREMQLVDSQWTVDPVLRDIARYHMS
jgi:hypothetical protein